MASRNDTDHVEPLLDHERNSLDIELSTPGDSHAVFSTKPQIATNKAPQSAVLIGLALTLTVIGFTINTEATAYFEDVLGWKKPFATMYITHSSLILPWLCHLAYDRFQHRQRPYASWVRQYNDALRQSIRTIDAYSSFGSTVSHFKLRYVRTGPLEYLCTMMGVVTLVLTVTGSSWFFALALTTPADLTAIYNCGTFFAALFSIPILHERLGRVSMVAVALSIAGTFVIAYGDTTADHTATATATDGDGDLSSRVGTSRLLGNLIACVGAVAFGLYEVVFKKWAGSSQPLAPAASLPMTLAATALLGFYTLSTLWVPLLFLHVFGIEPIVLPDVTVMFWIAVAVLTGGASITLLMVLVIWTDPIFGSMANVLSVFTVAIADWYLFGLKPSGATYFGGVLIMVAFGGLAWDTMKRGH